MTTLLPVDADGNPIPALRFKDGASHILSVSASSVRNSVAFSDETKVIGIYATGPVHLSFGDSSVTADASDHYFPAGIYYDIAVSGGGGKSSQDTHLAAIRADQDCVVYISEKE